MTTSVFLIALAAPFLWALVNHADKFLLSKYFKSGGIGGLMIFSTLFSAFLIPVVYIMDKNAINISFENGALLMLSGVVNAIAILCYLYALYDEEASVVVPFMQLIPVFTFVFGFMFLGETLTQLQVIAGLIIIFGAGLLSFEFKRGERIRFKFKVTMLMIGCSVCFALYLTLFKLVSIEDGFWTGALWEAFGLILTGVALFGIKKYRMEFVQIFERNSAPIIGLNIGSETLTVIGNWLSTFASLLAPLTLVALVSSYQPVFVFIMGIIATILLPHLVTEKISKGALLHKGLAIVIVVFGTYLLY